MNRVGNSIDPSSSNPPRIPDYELLRPIGKGSYGEVWLARSVTGVHRAVKIIHRHKFDSDRPYEREFRGIQRFEKISRSHESQVDVLHVGRNEPEGYFYYVMELADDVKAGEPDATVIDWKNYVPHTIHEDLKRQHRLPFGQCVELGIRLSTALDHLHQNGLIHRDVKPSNIIYVNGTPKLADIGLVAPQDDTMSFVGTIGYLPPEGPGAPQADIYGLGKVLYEVSSGKDRREFPDPPTEIGEDAEVETHAEFNEIVLKACSREIATRYQSAKELRSDLLLLQSGKSVRRLRLMERRVTLLGRIGAVGAVVIALSAGGFFYQSRQSTKLRQLERESRDRAVRLSVAQGVEGMEDSDYLSSLVWFTEALRLVHGDPEAEEVHRYRIEAVRRQCPTLAAMGDHGGPILSAAFSPDGTRIVVGGTDGTVSLWDVASSTRLASRSEHRGPVQRVTFSPDGKWIATASHDSTARIWRADNLELAGLELKHGNEVYDVCFNASSDRVATAGQDGKPRIWDRETGALVATLQHDQIVNTIRFSPDGSQVLTSSDDGSARLWRAENGEMVVSPLRHGGKVKCAVFSPDGNRVATASYDGTACIWDTKTGERLTPPIQHRGRLVHVEFSGDGQRLVTAGGESGVVGEVRICDVATGKTICTIDGRKRMINEARFVNGGARVVSDFNGESVMVWDAENGDPTGPAFRHSRFVTCIETSPDGRAILTAGRDGVWRVWRLVGDRDPPVAIQIKQNVRTVEFSPDGRRLLVGAETGPFVTDSHHPIETNRVWSHSGAIVFSGFSPDGQTFVTAGWSRPARIWNSENGRPVTGWLGHANLVRHAAFDRMGLRVATASDDRTARIWDAGSGQPVCPSLEHDASVLGATFSPDGRTLATAAGHISGRKYGEVRIWDTSDGRCLVTLTNFDTAVHGVRFSAGGSRLLTYCSDSTGHPASAQIWDASGWRPVGPAVEHADGLTGAEFSPDEKRIATASNDRTACVWDAESGARLGMVIKHARAITSITFSPDGRRIATGSHDRTARVWDAATGEPVSPPLACDLPVNWVRFSPDGLRLAAGAGLDKGHGEVRIWELPRANESVEELIRSAELLSGLSLDRTGSLTPIASNELYEMWLAERSLNRN